MKDITRKEYNAMKRSKRASALTMITALMLVIVTPAVVLAAGQGAKESGSRTLYHRLGGYDAIATFVDTAFPRVASNPKLERLFKGHSTDSKYRQRQLIIDILCRETGGPCVYTGRPMRPVHVGLEISEDDWNTFLKIITSALDELKWPETEKKEFLEIFQRRFKPDVVEK
jgi:hemoglobin